MRGRKVFGVALLAGLAPVLSGGQSVTAEVEARLLAAHNRERAALGIEALAWDPVLAAEARAWSRELAAREVMQHAAADEDDPQGENLWAGSVGYYTPEDMVDSWAEEKAQFRPGPFPHVSRTGQWKDVGHYTQMVWRETDRVGCHVARGQAFDYLVCRYRTAGNVSGRHVY
jgi:hypothetical protein